MRLALTGGATGIGAATVARLRADGHEIVVFDAELYIIFQFRVIKFDVCISFVCW